jgi:hypothetical protein
MAHLGAARRLWTMMEMVTCAFVDCMFDCIPLQQFAKHVRWSGRLLYVA